MENNEQQYTLEQIIESLYDFSDYGEEEKQSVIAETASMLTEATLLRSLDAAGEEVQNTFNDFIQTNPNEDQMMEWIQNNLPNFETILGEEITAFAEMGDEEETTTEA